MTAGGDFAARVYAAVAEIPRGRVMTYGQIALRLGFPGRARLVGRLLAHLPEGMMLPCHRVVRADGRLAPPEAFGGGEIQRGMLEREGVGFLPGGRVDLKRSIWRACMETREGSHE